MATEQKIMERSKKNGYDFNMRPCDHDHNSYQGMSLLDYFAGQIVSPQTGRHGRYISYTSVNEIAEIAYKQAAAMMRERAKIMEEQKEANMTKKEKRGVFKKGLNFSDGF